MRAVVVADPGRLCTSLPIGALYNGIAGRRKSIYLAAVTAVAVGAWCNCLAKSLRTPTCIRTSTSRIGMPVPVAPVSG